MDERIAIILAVEPFVDGFGFLEGPRWYDGRLWVSDMVTKTVQTVDAGGKIEMIASVPGRPSGIGFLPDKTPLVVSMEDRKILRIEGSGLVVHADLSGIVNDLLNDMIVDALGNAYVGHFGCSFQDTSRPELASLVHISPSGQSVRVVAEDLAFPNGMVIDTDRTTLVVAESAAHRLSEFDMEPNGSLKNRRIFAELGQYDPDGICIDGVGGIWVACYDEGSFIRVIGGDRISHRIPVPGRHAVACQLGGKNRDTLYCITCEGSWNEIMARRGACRIESVTVLPNSCA